MIRTEYALLGASIILICMYGYFALSNRKVDKLYEQGKRLEERFKNLDG